MLLMGVGYIAMGAIGGSNNPFMQAGIQSGGFFVVSGIFQLLFGALYLFPSIKLWKYGSSIRQLQLTQSVEDLEAAVAQQRGFWKFTGIMAIIAMIMFVLMIIGVIIFGLAVANQISSGNLQVPN